MPGVYSIVNKVNNKVYVGSTVRTFEERWDVHRRRLRKNYHPNAHLQYSWNKYGADAFHFEVLEELMPEEVEAGKREREQYWLDLFREQGEVYNIALVVAAPMCGRTHTKESRQKISTFFKGKKRPKEIGQRISRGKKGKISEENLRKLVERNKRRVWTDEARQKVSETRKGTVASEETKRKMSRALMGHPVSAETRQKIGDAHRGKKLSEKHILGMSKPYPALRNTQTGEIIPAGVGIKQLARVRGLHVSSLHHVITGKQRSTKGWILLEAEKCLAVNSTVS